VYIGHADYDFKEEDFLTMTPMAALPGIPDVLTAGSLVDVLTGLTVDQLRALEGRLEDAHRVCRAIIRERLALARRDERWRARELLVVGSESDGV
jgi:hypothetical protein